MENELVKELTISDYIWSLSDLVDRKRLKKKLVDTFSTVQSTFYGFQLFEEVISIVLPQALRSTMVNLVSRH